jgi:hypothetical protein
MPADCMFAARRNDRDFGTSMSTFPPLFEYELDQPGASHNRHDLRLFDGVRVGIA